MTLSNAELYRLKSDARRGLLENDLILRRFFDRYGDQLNAEDGKVLGQLLALEDNDLMDLLLQRNDLPASLDSEDRRAVLAQLRMSTLEPSASTPLTC